MTDLSSALFSAADHGANAIRKKLALESINKAQIELLDLIDGGDECQGRDSRISEILRLLDAAEYQVEQMKL